MTASTASARPVSRLLGIEERPAWQEKPAPATRGAKGGAVIVILLLILVPLYTIVLTSLSTQASVNIAGGLVMVPHGVTIEAYRQIFTNQLIVHSLFVTGAITVVGTSLSMVISVLAAYGMSRKGSFLHRTILMTFVVTMFFSGGIIPTFLLVSALGGYPVSYTHLTLPTTERV